jgi:hypothetical protein
MPVTTTLDGIPPSTEVRTQLAEAGRPVLLAFSRGKDSIAAWLALCDAGVDVRPFYLYLIPGLLGFERASLTYFEDYFGTPIPAYPHPGLYRWLRQNVFQPPDRWRAIQEMRLPNLTHEKVNAMVRADYGLPPGTWVADGVRAADSLPRRAAIKTHGAFRPGSGKCSPVWDWDIRETMQAIHRSKVRLPVDYKWFGRSFAGLDLRFLAPLAKRAPDDYQRVLDWFPLADLELHRAAMTGKRAA